MACCHNNKRMLGTFCVQIYERNIQPFYIVCNMKAASVYNSTCIYCRTDFDGGFHECGKNTWMYEVLLVCIPVAILLPHLICVMYRKHFVIVKIVSLCLNGYILLVSLETTNWLKESVCVYVCCCADPGLGQE